jgi:ABC-type transporter Mla MlaB component
MCELKIDGNNIYFKGIFNQDTLLPIEKELTSILSTTVSNILYFDLKQVSSCDSFLLGVVLHLKESAKSLNKKIVVLQPPSQLSKLASMSQMEHLI